jgi:hypothetical protein
MNAPTARRTLTLPHPRPAAAAIRRPPPKGLSPWWPRPYAPHYSWVIPHPVEGLAFCLFPEIKACGHVFAEADVFLLYGRHWDRSKGFGCLHIIEGHWREIGLKSKEPDLTAVAHVAEFVAAICSRGAQITCEFASLRGDHRPMIIRAPGGMVVLEYKTCRDTGIGYYSVVTAMAATKAKGPVIGAL